MTLRRRILDRLQIVGFRIGEGTIAPFGQPLPLVTAWATEESTASLALIVEDPTGVSDKEPWRELLFALSGLRHELRDGGAPALGTPVVIALLKDTRDAESLRGLIEELSQEYVLFSRVELNVLVETSDKPNIDLALAPLLPRTREALKQGVAIGGDSAAELADELRKAIEQSVIALPPLLQASAHTSALAYADQLAGLITSSSAQQGFTPNVWSSVHLENFRAFKNQELPLGALTLAEGLNGTGKSSLVEALEILWAGTTQRKPADEKASTYDKHLARNGDERWSITGVSTGVDGEPATRTVGETEEHPAGALARNVFSQDGSPDIASAAAPQRYAELLRITGLAIPELLAECERLTREAKANLDRVLSGLRIPATKSIAIRAVDYVRDELRITATLPTENIRGLEAAVVDASKKHGLAFRPHDIGTLSDGEVERLNALGKDLSSGLRSSNEFVQLARSISGSARESAASAQSRAQAIEVLLARLATRRQADQIQANTETLAIRRAEPRPSGLPQAAATEWLFAGRSLRQSVDGLRGLDRSTMDQTWATRLDRFLALADQALGQVPFDELELTTRSQRAATPPARRQPAEPIDPSVLRAAGFEPTGVTDIPQVVEEPLSQFSRSLRAYASQLGAFAEAIQSAPLVLLEGGEEALLDAVGRFELAKALKKPVSAAQDELLTRLISGPLEPLFVELIMALTRFEWYFHPPKMTVRRGTIGFYGLATESDQLDVRMLLNAGERAIVTLAWFLALHLLQPPDQRRALVLDDPFSTLDENNQAALVATLRTFARLTRPDFLLISTHDRVVADMVERDFASMAGWPASRAKLHFARAPDGTTITEGEVAESPEADYMREISRLGLDQGAELTTAEMA